MMLNTASRAVVRSTATANVSRRALFSTKTRSHLVVNAVGLDRPGIVSEVTKIITDNNGNVGESRAIKLGDHFSMMMLVSVPSESDDAVKSALDRMDLLHIAAYNTSDPKSVVSVPRIGYEGHFKLSGADNPGIVHKVTSVLASHGCNIDKLKTSDEEAPFGGTTLFRMEGIVTAPEPLPKSFDADAIREHLGDLGDSLNCDVTMEDFVEDDVSYSVF